MTKRNQNKRKRHIVPQLNATSMADISFMLLIFFLVVSSLEQENGMKRQLPPPDDTEQQQPVDVDEKTVLTLTIDSANTIAVNDAKIKADSIKIKLKEHIACTGKKHIIEIKASKHAEYDTYFNMQDIISSAYRELRNEYAQKKYKLDYKQCTPEQQTAIKEAIPQRIAESFF